MNVLKLGSVGVVLAAAIAVVLAERRVNQALRAELVHAQRSSREFVQLQKQNQGLAAEIDRLAAMPPPPAPTQIPNRPRSTPRPARVALAPGFSPTAECRNVGIATARDAFETYIWAVDHGDVAALAGTLKPSDAAQAKIDALYASLPAAGRMKYGSAEQMFATVFAYSNPVNFFGMEVTNESPAGPNLEVLSTKWEFPMGQIREHAVPLTLTPAGWKRPVTDGEAESALGQILRPP